MKNKLNVLISGGSGFIGKSLTENLKNDFKVYSPKHKELDFLNSSSVTNYLINNNIDIVIHCAIEEGPNLLQNSILMFSNIIRNADNLKRIIFFGSGAEYSKNRNLNKIKEREIGKFIPTHELGLSKLICTEMAKNRKNIINLRPFGIYGKYENYIQAFISNSIAKSLLGLPITIYQDVVFDYLYIEDLFPVVRHLLKHKNYDFDYNITPDNSITLTNILAIINEISKYPINTKIIKPGMNFSYTGDNHKIKKLIKDLKFTSYEKGVKEIYEYNLKNINSLNRNLLLQNAQLTKIIDYEKSKKII